jgi:hypothetical protein
VSYCLLRNPAVRVHTSEQRVTGVLSLSQSMNYRVAKGAKQEPPPGSGIDSFEFWLPARRPGGKNLAIAVEPALRAFDAQNVTNGVSRPWRGVNAWVAARGDAHPALTLSWAQEQMIAEVHLDFDTDFDHPMESVLMGHPEREMPFCVKSYRLLAGGAVVHEEIANHQTRNVIRLARAVKTRDLRLEVKETWGAPAAVFAVRCYSE